MEVALNLPDNATKREIDYALSVVRDRLYFQSTIPPEDVLMRSLDHMSLCCVIRKTTEGFSVQLQRFA